MRSRADAKPRAIRFDGTLGRALALLLWLVIWQLASVWVGQQLILVSPLSAVTKLFEMMRTAQFYQAVLGSFARVLLGFVLALAVGALLSVLSAAFRPVRLLLEPPMAAISATPIASFVILALVLIGSRNLSIFISFLMVLPVIYVNLLRGIESADPGLLEMAQVFGLGRMDRLRAIYAPAVLPFLLSAVKIALGMCWKSGLAAEVIGQPRMSVGEALYKAKIFYATDEVFAWTLAIIIVSVGFERLVLLLVDRVSRRFLGREADAEKISS